MAVTHAPMRLVWTADHFERTSDLLCAFRRCCSEPQKRLDAPTKYCVDQSERWGDQRIGATKRFDDGQVWRLARKPGSEAASCDAVAVL